MGNLLFIHLTKRLNKFRGEIIIIFQEIVIPPAVLLISIPVIIFLILYPFKLRFKLSIKSLAFRVLLLTGIGFIVLLEIAIIALDVFNKEIYTLIGSYSIGIAFTIYVFYYTMKVITRQEETIKQKNIDLITLIKKSSDSSLNVASMAVELASSANEVNAAAAEISSTTQSVADQAQNQVNSLFKIQTMAESIRDVSNEVIGSSKDIEIIMDLLHDISDKTDLLALNASIEAGRAGNHGRGFAVVAEEVRKLAEGSKKSISESADKIESIIKLINKIGHLISTITSEIESSTSGEQETAYAMASISASTEQQTQSMEEISSTASKLGKLAEELKETLARGEEERILK